MAQKTQMCSNSLVTKEKQNKHNDSILCPNWFKKKGRGGQENL